jgi:preprotein translocase subunit YajC
MNSNDLINNFRRGNKYKLVLVSLTVLVTFFTFFYFFSSQSDSKTDQERLEAEAQKRVGLMNRRQQKYFSKHQTFFKADDSPGVAGSGFRFNPSTCYGYYTIITENAVFSYGRQDACSDSFSGFALDQYIGGVFAVRGTKNVSVETLAVLCQKKGSRFYSRAFSDQPLYKDGAIFCAPGTRQR